MKPLKHLRRLSLALLKAILAARCFILILKNADFWDNTFTHWPWPRLQEYYISTSIISCTCTNEIQMHADIFTCIENFWNEEGQVLPSGCLRGRWMSTMVEKSTFHCMYFFMVWIFTNYICFFNLFYFIFYF